MSAPQAIASKLTAAACEHDDVRMRALLLRAAKTISDQHHELARLHKVVAELEDTLYADVPVLLRRQA